MYAKFSASRRAPDHQIYIPADTKNGAKELDIPQAEETSSLSHLTRQNSLNIHMGKWPRQSKPLPAIPAHEWTLEDSETTNFSPHQILPPVSTFPNSSRPPPQASIPTDIEDSICGESPCHSHDVGIDFDIESMSFLLIHFPTSPSVVSTNFNFVLSQFNKGSSPDTSGTNDKILHSHGKRERRNGIITFASKRPRFHVQRGKGRR